MWPTATSDGPAPLRNVVADVTGGIFWCHCHSGAEPRVLAAIAGAGCQVAHRSISAPTISVSW